MRRAATLVPQLVLAGGLAACATGLAPGETLDSPIVSIAVDSVTAGAIVEMEARNVSAATWRYNACAGPRLQQREDDAWVDAPDPLLLCSDEQDTLSAGATRSLGVAIPMGALEGTYRVRFRVVRSDGVEAAPTTNTFVVH